VSVSCSWDCWMGKISSFAYLCYADFRKYEHWCYPDSHLYCLESLVACHRQMVWLPFLTACVCFWFNMLWNVNEEKQSRFSDTSAIGEFHELLCGPIRKAHLHLSFILFAKHLCFFAKQERKQLEELPVGLYVLSSWINVQQVFALTWSLPIKPKCPCTDSVNVLLMTWLTFFIRDKKVFKEFIIALLL